MSLTAVFGMGTGGPSLLITPTISVFCFRVSIDLFSRAVASQVFSAQMSLTAVFGMGTGGPSSLMTLTIYLHLCADIFLYGAPSGIRTRDPLIKSQLLYQLS